VCIHSGMLIQEYLDKVNKRYKTGISTEHSFRGDLQTFLESLVPDVQVINEPSHIECGAPDYIITKKKIPVGYIEAKDIGKPLDSKEYKEQFDRYRKSLDNLIITDYLDFWLYHEGQFITSIKIADIVSGKIVPIPDNFQSFTDLIKNFCTYVGQTIKSAAKLSKMMAGKARLLADIIERAIISDEKGEEDQLHEAANTSLRDQLAAFKHVLIHDISAKDFADIYAQTIAYGMFAARLHDPTLEDFTRQEAAELIPKSNPFLRKLFLYIAGYDLDDRIKWIVDALADIFRATDVAALLDNFGKTTQQNDPIIHFYETFLAEYDPKLRKSRGVWYTPEPVVNFIVRAVDDIIKTEFNLPQGLADISKTVIEVDTQTKDNRLSKGYKREKKEVHKVQILDPAAGTGTFLAEVVKQIYKRFEGQEGIWSNYVENHLIPRVHGFELLMASYSMAHLKLYLLLKDTGYKPKKQQRLKIYLTNSLEEYHPDTGTLFASWLSAEANEANHVKRDTPVMVVLGNPPYSGISSNMGSWIVQLIEDYKYIAGEHFGERKHWLQDDYVKFIRYGQHLVEKNSEGILAYINNHSFLDNPTFRGMRWNLLNAFDLVYIINLQGSTKKQDSVPEGMKDENVFDIQQGVSINILVKKKSNAEKSMATVYYSEIWGTRKEKYQLLNKSNIDNIKFNKINYSNPYYFMSPKDEKLRSEYEEGFKISDLYKLKSMGITSARDDFVVSFDEEILKARFNDLVNPALTDLEIYSKYNLKDTSTFKLKYSRNKLIKYKSSGFLTRVLYRPFDKRYILYSSLLVERPLEKVLTHMKSKSNLALISCRMNRDNRDTYFVSNCMADKSLISSLDNSYVFPLYLFKENQSSFKNESQISNFNPLLIDRISSSLGLKYNEDRGKDFFSPEDLFNYIYAILHCDTYLKKYKEFLKLDFPRIPYPKDKKTFWKLVKHGFELRQIHLLESPKVDKYITTYPKDGDNIVTRRISQKDFEMIDYIKGRVWINDQQYFDKVPKIAWEFYIGGYQPAQKWLKDRCRRQLSYEDILHYQKIIVALTETDRIMKEIDKIDLE